MLRTGQMILARVLICRFLANEYKLSPGDPIPVQSVSRESEILRLFADYPAGECPFSVHNIVEEHKRARLDAGERVKKASRIVVEWFAPSTIAAVLRRLIERCMPHALAMFVPVDGVIYLDQVVALCSRNGASDAAAAGGEVPCFVLVPVRLGLEKVNEEYVPELKKLFALPQCVGIIGGRQRESLYFVGHQDDNLIYLDPHIVHKAEGTLDTQTYHCQFPQTVSARDIAPSLAIGFYCAGVADARHLVAALVQIQAATAYPIVTAAEQTPDYLCESCVPRL
eukprot:TRINITY_DN3549_c0_g1_i2.p2 TRINITY_DN3549_c0_g1~~TRINITY_DN3549_c0_g1_i2.p2  ORF type:complete len:282 (+),score=69.03 TRINITY_DN3549_c0_g1_i2:926-1771(+)